MSHNTDMDNSRHYLSCVLTALYLPSVECIQRVPRRRWPAIEQCLRAEPAELERLHLSLRRNGFWLEASALQDSAVLASAEKRVLAGQVLTAIDDLYPRRWRLILGGAAPPVFWIDGVLSERPFVSMVGSRGADLPTREFARQAGMAAVTSGFAVASGGAFGCDRCAVSGAVAASRRAGITTQAVEVLPMGISVAPVSASCRLSAVAPTNGFSSAAAMERNALLYSVGESSLVVKSGFREGGTWIGATDALRRKLTRLFVRDDGTPGARALSALGATLIGSPEAMFMAGAATPPEGAAQPPLRAAEG